METVRLDTIDEGTTVRTVGFSCGPSLRRRLASLGIRQDSQLQILQKVGNGRAVVRIGFGHIALGRDVLQSLLVVPLRDPVTP